MMGSPSAKLNGRGRKNVYISAPACHEQATTAKDVNNRDYLIGWPIRGRLVSGFWSGEEKLILSELSFEQQSEKV